MGKISSLKSGIRVGNLAYHYNNKETIIESLIAEVIADLQGLLRQHGRYAVLSDLDFFLKAFYALCTRYLFSNFDILEIKRNFPGSYDLSKPHLNEKKLQLERRLSHAGVDGGVTWRFILR